MNSHDSIAPTKVGNSRTEAATGPGRSLNLHDLFLSLVYGLLFGSLAFLTGCLEGGDGRSTGGQSQRGWSSQEFEDEELSYLNTASLEDRLQFPFSQEKPPTEWTTSVAGNSDEFGLALEKQTGPLVLHLTGSVTLTKEYVARFPIWIDATPTQLYPNSKLLFGTLGAISMKAAETRTSHCVNSNGRFNPGAMSYLGLFGDVNAPLIKVLTPAHVVVNSPRKTNVRVEATAESLVVSHPGSGEDSGYTNTFNVDHTVLLSGVGTATGNSGHEVRPILNLATSNDIVPNANVTAWCMRSITLGNYVINSGYTSGVTSWKRLNRENCERGSWKDVVTTAWSCDSAMPTTGGAQ